MKKLIISLAVSALIAASFCSCSMGGNNTTSSQNNSSGTLGDVISDVVSEAEDIVSDIGDAVSDAVSDAENNMTDSGKLDGASPSDAAAAVEMSGVEILSSEKHCWGQGTITDENNRPVSCDDFQNKYGKYDAHFIKGNSEKKIYLTFDQGYENGCTAPILNTLKEKKVSAVFFVTYDYAKRNPELIKRMINEGHIIGNHSYKHISMPEAEPHRAVEEIVKLHEYIKKEFNYEMILFRPPMGEFSEQTLEISKQLGYKTIFWSFAYKDWDTTNQPLESKSLNKLVDRLHNGAIYLLHAVSKTNASILPSFIDKAKSQGYTFDIDF